MNYGIAVDELNGYAPTGGFRMPRAGEAYLNPESGEVGIVK